jgi:hypothetical protein
VDSSLQAIARDYSTSSSPTSNTERIRAVYSSYVKNREDSLIDAAAAAASITHCIHDGSINYSAITPQAEQAFHLAYPHVQLSSLPQMDANQLQGVMNGWKGKLFEVIVRDRLNNGEWVGDLHLLQGQEAVLAHSPIQPGWDVQIFGPDNHVVSELQLKASESLAYAKSALERFPNIDVLTTHEAAAQGTGVISGLLDSGISDHDLQESISAPLEQLIEHGWLDIFDFVQDVAPFIPFVIIGAMERRHVMMGKKSFEIASGHALERAWKSGISMAVGAVVIWLDGGLLSIPTAMLTRIGIERYQMVGRIELRFNSRIVQAKALLAEYV